jgi:aminoglycoside phosphotransferase (APT) family kinase protein
MIKKMINPNFTVNEISSRFFSYLSGKLGAYQIEDELEQLTGGQEAYLYKFRISGVEDYDGPMVLRLFPSYYHPETAEWQEMLHNLIQAEGVPVPRVYLSVSDTSILGGTFLVMDFVEGDAIDPEDDPNILPLTAKTQALLHQKDGQRISNEILVRGHSLGSHTFDGRMQWIVSRSEKYSGLEDWVNWLVENRPPEPEKNMILHGDFHPMNLLVKDGKVNTILDWSGFMVGDPMYDLGWTKALLIATAKHETPPDVFDQIMGVYMEAYGSISPIDHEKLDYFVVYRLVRALFEGKEGQLYWTREDIVENICSVLSEMTGISGHL